MFDRLADALHRLTETPAGQIGTVTTSTGVVAAAATNAWGGITAAGAGAFILTLTGALCLAYDQACKARRRNRREDAEQELALAKIRDEQYAESLAGKLDAVNRALAEQRESYQHVRASLHAVRNQLQAVTLERDDLRDRLAALTADAGRIAHDTRRIKTAVDQLSGSSDEIPSSGEVTPLPEPPPEPDADGPDPA